MELLQIKYFRVIAETENISKASEQLFIAQPSLSQTLKRLEDELAASENEIKRAQSKLANENFVSRAPAAVVDAERAKLEKYKAQSDGIRAALDALRGK